jgi:hypothetical protein
VPTRRIPACHPDRAHCAKGQCRVCYMAAHYRRPGEAERNRERVRARRTRLGQVEWAKARRRYWQKRQGRMPLYSTWNSMIGRCYRPSDHSYERYGRQSIRIHQPWRRSYENFEAWVLTNLGPRPSGHTLDRIDPYGNYEPGNLRWATFRTQRVNRRGVKAA